MKPFTRHRGTVAPLLRNNVDTDAIIPSREMKRVSKRGLADGLFAGWRYLEAGSREPNPVFVLNDPRFAGATILLSGENFGCGSSREHAVWALAEYGFRALVAPSYGAIFYGNCIANGILPVRLPLDVVRDLGARAENDAPMTLAIDLETRAVTVPGGETHRFEIGESHREMLLNGWDPIDLTLRLDDEIAAFEARDRERRPWVYAGS